MLFSGANLPINWINWIVNNIANSLFVDFDKWFTAEENSWLNVSVWVNTICDLRWHYRSRSSRSWLKNSYHRFRSINNCHLTQAKVNCYCAANTDIFNRIKLSRQLRDIHTNIRIRHIWYISQLQMKYCFCIKVKSKDSSHCLFFHVNICVLTKDPIVVQPWSLTEVVDATLLYPRSH